MPVVIPVSAIHETGPSCQEAVTSVKPCGAAAGRSASLHRNAATCPRFNVLSGEKVVDDVPVVIPVSDIHETASLWVSSATSPNEWLLLGCGRIDMFQIHTAVSPRDTGRSGPKHDPGILVTL